MIVDTHIHIWDLQHSTYNWLKGAPALLNRTYALPELEESRKAVGITGGILVQADNTLGDTQLMLEAASKNDWIKGVVGWLPLVDTATTKKMIDENWLNEKYLVGVRHLIHDEQDPRWLLQQNVINSLEVLAGYDIPFDVVGVLPEHIKTVLEVSRKVPGLRMVLDHMNQPPIKEEERFGAWGEWMQQASENKNFFVKISGLGGTAGADLFTADNIKPYVKFILEQFGTDRCFCGGDWPVSLLGKDYITTWNIYKNVIEELIIDETERQSVFWKNANNFYKLNIS